MDSHELNDCFIAAMTERCQQVPGATVERVGGLVSVFSHLPLASNYCIFSSAPLSHTDFEARVDAAVGIGERAAVPWHLVILADWLPTGSSDAGFDAHGLRRVGTLYGMRATALAAPRRDPPPMVVRRATCPEHLDPMVLLNNVAYGHEATAGASLYLAHLGAGASAFVGYVGDEPVTCVGTFLTPQGIYLGALATAEHWRGRGYGEAIVRHALSCATEETGLSRSVLFASRRKAPFYEPIGFTASAELCMYRRVTAS